jgi:nicotinamide phosphoribosyltransferase
MFRPTPYLAQDGYKVDHRSQYPDGIENVAANLTARKTRRPYTNKVVQFGLQYFIKDHLIDSWNKDFFSQPKAEVIRKFKRRIDNYLGPDKVKTDHLEALHDLGYLPLEIYALPEGTEYNIRVPGIALWATNPQFAWLTNFIETVMSANVWGMATSATTAHAYKKLLTRYAMETVGDASFVNWQGHDFSYRGMFGDQAAAMSGAAHLISFTGTDTIPAIEFLEQYYNADCEKELIGGSVPATEHSVSCATILSCLQNYHAVEETFNEVTQQWEAVMYLSEKGLVTAP